MTAIFSTDKDFARIAELCMALGVPQDDWVLFWRWADELPTGKAVDELSSYVDVLIAQRCLNPGDDVMSQLIALDMTDEEIRTRVGALVVKPETKLSPYKPSRA
ncbi:hypothetical protein [Mycobacterium sp. RTGN5]|uniref:hypothetical protein n=1 Tax=Mycobacterium sp. RTGN5 TaxID=3016522 RepID=UPI0029C77E96|nr:hypothetical protein [Mycobacterium sp. RTGN5]